MKPTEKQLDKLIALIRDNRPVDETGHILDDNGTCWCEPDIEDYEEGGRVVIHKDKGEHN